MNTKFDINFNEYSKEFKFKKYCTVQNVLEIQPDSLKDVAGNLALKVKQWFIAVVKSRDPTFHKTNGCQTGSLEPFEKDQKDRKIENYTKLSPVVLNGHVVARY